MRSATALERLGMGARIPSGVNLILAFLAVLVAGGVGARSPATRPEPRAVSAGGVNPNQDRVNEAYGNLPLYFEPNQGQTARQVRFLARGSGHTLFLTPSEAVLVLRRPDKTAKGKSTSNGKGGRHEKRSGTVLRMVLRGADPKPRVSGEEERLGRVNYFIGNDPAKWLTNMPTYARVRYRDVYPGIDVTYYGNQHELEYDFVVGAGADPRRIMLDFAGAARVEVDAQGDLVLHTALGPIRQRRPAIYQEIDGARREIAGGYVLKGRHRVGFRVGAYDANRPLIIDPIMIAYSTYLGGTGIDVGNGIAVDATGNAYVTGFTESTDFPTTAGAFQPALGGYGNNAFITKLNPQGSALVYSTYLGGTGRDEGHGITVDPVGNAYVTGFTFSTDFPTTAGAFQTTFGGGVYDAFVTKLNPQGSALVYSTYLGGTGIDEGHGIAADATGNAYVTGSTDSTDFPTTAGAFQTVPGGAFITKLNSQGSALLYSTYLGGSGGDKGYGIAVDATGNAYVTGVTSSTNFPTTPGAFQTVLGGESNAFITKLNPQGSALVYSTYLGGTGEGDEGLGIAVDAIGNAYVSGDTSSTDFPTTDGAFQPALRGDENAFVTKLNPQGSALLYSTYLGGSSFGDAGSGIAVDPMGNAYVTGFAESTDFPTTPGAFQTVFGGVVDAFVARFAPQALGWQTRIRGSGTDFATNEAYALVVDASGNVIAAGVLTAADGSTQFAVVKLSGISGTELWRKTPIGGAALAIALDPAGFDVVAAGVGIAADGTRGFTVVKLSGFDGTELWRQVILGPDNLGGQADAVAVDGDGNVVAAGNIQDRIFFKNYVAIKFAGADGGELWRQVVHGGSDRRGEDNAFAVTVDGAGNGASAGIVDTASDVVSKFTVVSTSPGGWLRVVQGTDLDVLDRPDNIAVAVLGDGTGNVVAAGELTNIDTGRDIAVIKFSGADGDELWRRVVDGSAHDDDSAFAAAIDSRGSVTVAGYLRNIGGTQYTLLKFSGGDGSELWRHVIDVGPALVVATDGAGDVVTGGGAFTAIKLSGLDGSELWRRVIDGNGTSGIAADRNNDVLTAGSTISTTFQSSDDFTVTKLRGGDGSDF